MVPFTNGRARRGGKLIAASAVATVAGLMRATATAQDVNCFNTRNNPGGTMNGALDAACRTASVINGDENVAVKNFAQASQAGGGNVAISVVVGFNAQARADQAIANVARARDKVLAAYSFAERPGTARKLLNPLLATTLRSLLSRADGYRRRSDNLLYSLIPSKLILGSRLARAENVN